MGVEVNKRFFHKLRLEACPVRSGSFLMGCTKGFDIKALYTLLMSYILGVDEAGRGPLAGPVAVAVIAVREGHPVLRKLRGVRDSKKLSERQREAWFAHIRNWSGQGSLRYAISFSSAGVIDKRGIVKAVAAALARAVRRLGVPPKKSRILLDGSLYAPSEFIFQKTIIGGDEKVRIIALASIVAKVMRDRRMKRLARKYPEYGFDVHKGYGSKAHIAHIRRHGLSDVHRQSFCKNFG